MKPLASDDFDQGGELTVVISERGRRLREADALDHEQSTRERVIELRASGMLPAAPAI